MCPLSCNQYEPGERDNRVNPPADDSGDGDLSDDTEDDPQLGNTMVSWPRSIT